MPTPNNPALSEYVLEFRYKPNPKVLDYRGTWAELLSKYMEVDHFLIRDNRIDVFDDNQSMRLFVSFMNSGIILRNSPSHQFFADKCERFIRFIFEEKAFGNPVFITRLGVRYRFACNFEGSFDDLIERTMNRQISLSPDALGIFGAKITDIGCPINFKTNDGNINTMSGPMTKKQLMDFFKFERIINNSADAEEDEYEIDFPDVSFYMDLDYWNLINENKNNMELIKQIRHYSKAIEAISNKMSALILK